MIGETGAETSIDKLYSPLTENGSVNRQEEIFRGSNGDLLEVSTAADDTALLSSSIKTNNTRSVKFDLQAKEKGFFNNYQHRVVSSPQQYLEQLIDEPTSNQSATAHPILSSDKSLSSPSTDIENKPLVNDFSSSKISSQPSIQRFNHHHNHTERTIQADTSLKASPQFENHEHVQQTPVAPEIFEQTSSVSGFDLQSSFPRENASTKKELNEESKKLLNAIIPTCLPSSTPSYTLQTGTHTTSGGASRIKGLKHSSFPSMTLTPDNYSGTETALSFVSNTVPSKSQSYTTHFDRESPNPEQYHLEHHYRNHQPHSNLHQRQQQIKTEQNEHNPTENYTHSPLGHKHQGVTYNYDQSEKFNQQSAQVHEHKSLPNQSEYYQPSEGSNPSTDFAFSQAMTSQTMTPAQRGGLSGNRFDNNVSTFASPTAGTDSRSLLHTPASNIHSINSFPPNSSIRYD